MSSRGNRRKRGLKLDRRLLILVSIMPVGCLVALMVGLATAWFIMPTEFINARTSDLSEEEAQQVVIMIAADYAEYEDVDRAREMLSQLAVPNPAQYVAMTAEQMIRTNRGEVDQEIENVVALADALEVSTVSMIAYVSTPTTVPTPLPAFTPTPTNTPVVPTATPSPVVEAQAQAMTVADEGEAVEEEPAEEAPIEEAPVAEAEVVEEAPAPVEEAPVEEAPVAAAEAAPAAEEAPAEEPAPEPTEEPAATDSEFDFVVTKQRLFTKEENGGCAGMHNIFVTVQDANGNPIKGVEVGDVWGNPGVLTGHKGEDRPGEAVFDLYKNGFVLAIRNDPTAGKEITSEQTIMLSSNDWEIGIPKLIEAGYCPDEGTCRQLWNSGVFGEGNNSLCWGHYSWEVIFQRTW